MRFFCYTLIFCICYAVPSFSQTKFDAKQLQVTWSLIGNHFKGSNQSRAVFNITNKSNQPFPATGWTIYFSSSRNITKSTATAGAIVEHVNGDLYKLAPGKDSRELGPGKTARIEYDSDGELINYTGAPSGLYIVWDYDPENGFPLSGFSITPLVNTVPGIVTPQKIFLQNQSIGNIPATDLPKIFPTPVSYKERSGVFQITPGVVIQADPAFLKEAQYLSGELNQLFGSTFQVNTAAGNEKTIVLQKAALNKEAYRLIVTKEQITITAASGNGVFSGIQSLRSLMPAEAFNGMQSVVTVPVVEVEDEPRFSYRSLMLDVARNFKTKETIFRILDLMAMYKMNVLHFHFSDDEGWRIEIPSLPELTGVGAVRGHTQDSKTRLPVSYGSGPIPGVHPGSGYYSRSDFMEVLRYATERHIQVIPEIESPGHSRAAIKAMNARYEQLISKGKKAEAEEYLLCDPDDKSVYISAQQWTDNVICVARPSAYRFMAKVIDELLLMYKEAGASLSTIHMGGDETPAGAWEGSPLCRQLIATDSSLQNANDLWYYYYKKVNDIVQSRGLFMSGWEELGMRKTVLDGQKTMIVNPAFARENMLLHVWNNVTGWGAEDLPYRLANAGYKVVLSPVSNNYLDLAYFKHPDEPGYYWGGFQDIDKPFYFIPFDYYKTSREDPDGNPVNPNVFIGKDRLTDYGKSNIVGIQGLLWNENVRTDDQLDYLLLPKLLGVAERAWAKDPSWADEKDTGLFKQRYNADWSVFVNVIGKRELPRLDYLSGGFKYRIPTAGAKVVGGAVEANVQLPGLVIRYTTDGTTPTVFSKPYSGPITQKGEIRLRVFTSNGRGSRVVVVRNL
ncbi:MAG: carbohydate-binding domain-containing protein [Sphingobacteriia bacterium]|nr:carbohydate-binding domain-containing protein [Sphingobacteriia bacterium]